MYDAAVELNDKLEAEIEKAKAKGINAHLVTAAIVVKNSIAKLLDIIQKLVPAQD